MNRIFKVTAILGPALMFVLSAADKTREQTLQRAIDLMESKGDLAKAMPFFEDAARSSDRAVAARALLYLGQAQERQGTEKARATYQRIINEFGSQTEAVVAAQKRLVALGGSAATNILVKRLLCTDCGDGEANFSPDGRLMVFTDWDSGDLAIRDMSTGKVKRLMAKTGTVSGAWKDTDAFGESPVFSRDLRQIVYCWNTGGKEQRDQLRVMPNEPGAKSRVLIDNPEYDFLEPTAWSADGKSVLVMLKSKRDGTGQLARVSVVDGTVNTLKSMGWRSGYADSHPAFSPDGQYIVYHALAVNPSRFEPAATDSKDQHIYILRADGSLETEVVKTAGINQYPVWTPDGKHILFVSDRSGKSDLWSIPVRNGRPAGAESLVGSELGKVGAVSMNGSSYYYERGLGVEYVHVAEFVPGSNHQNRVLDAAESFVGTQPVWSPDGKSIAFKRRHSENLNEYDLVVRSLETGDERLYRTNLGVSGPGRPLWFRDGKSVIVGIGGQAYRVDLATAEFKEMRALAVAHALPSDEKTRYAVRSDPKNWDKLPARIIATDLDSGQEREIFTLPEAGPVVIWPNPDGRTLLGWMRDQKTRRVRLFRLNVNGTGYREISTLDTQNPLESFTLAKDGRSILCVKQNSDNHNLQILRIPIESGTLESTGIELAHRPRGGMDLSPDGSRLAFTTRKNEGEIWVLDNVLSVLK